MSAEPDSDYNQLMSKIQGLLSFQPDKADKFASTNITKPAGDVKRKLAHGFFDPTCGLTLGMQTVGGYSYYHSYYNLNKVKRGSSILHLYKPDLLPPYLAELDESVMVVLHSHDSAQYCPWRAGCHVILPLEGSKDRPYPVGYRIADTPKWFQDMWNYIYTEGEQNA